MVVSWDLLQYLKENDDSMYGKKVFNSNLNLD